MSEAGLRLPERVIDCDNDFGDLDRSKKRGMKALFDGKTRVTQKLGTFGVFFIAVAASFLLGQCIRALLIATLEFILREWIGYLTLLSC